MSPGRGIVRSKAAGCAAAILVLAACSGPMAEDEAIDEIPAFDINPVPRDRLKDGGILRWAVPEFPTQWNLNHADGAKGVVEHVVQGLLPRAMRTDERGVPRPDPEYVREAEVTATAPRQVVTYTLNPDAAWSDGTAITHRDFAAQARALSGADPRYQTASTAGYGRIAKVARGEHARQVVVTFAKPYAEWAALFSPLYPAATNSDPAAFNSGWVNRLPVTAGPFRVAGIDQATKTVALARDPAWWGAPAKLDRIVFRAMDPGAVAGAFANGEVDVLDIGTDTDAFRRAGRVEDAVIRKAGGPDWRHFTFNASSASLADVRVRRALMLGLDREAIAEAGLKELGWPVQVMNNHFFVNTQQGYRDNSAGLGRYDPRRARTLLDRAGWVRRGEIRVKNGRPLRLRFVVPSGSPVSKQEAELAEAMLGRIGVRVEIRPVPTDEMFDRYVKPGNFDIVAFSWLGEPYPISSNVSVFANPRGKQIQQNYARVGSPEIDEAMQAAMEELGPAKARRLVNKADVLIWRQAGVLPLYQRPQLVAVPEDLANFGAGGLYQPVYQDIGYMA